MVETRGSTTSESHPDKPKACFEDESLTQNVKKEHSLVRSVTPDEEIPLDYVESEESPISDASPHKRLKQEDNSIDTEEMLLKDVVLTSSPSPERGSNNITNGHVDKSAEPRTPGFDGEEVLGDNLELRSLNDEIGQSDDNAPSYVDGAVAISDDDENETTSQKTTNKRRRPRTPLSPCPEDVSNDELDIPDASEDISERRGKRNSKVLSRVVRVNKSGDGPSGEVPEAYRRPRRRPRGGRRVRAAAMRQAALRRDIDSRLLENRRVRLERLREAQNRRAGSDRHVPRRDVPERNRRIRETSYNEAGRPMPALNWVPPVAEVSRRNPSYYPPRRSRSPPFRIRSPLPSSSRGRSPFLSSRLRATPPVRRPLLPISSTSSRRNRSPTPPSSSRNLPLPRRSTFDHRQSPPPRSRSPQRIPHRPVPNSRPLWASSSRNGDRRYDSSSSYSSSRRRCSPPLISRYPGPRDSRHRDLSSPSRHGRELSRPSLPLPPVKRWRCPPREPSP